MNIKRILELINYVSHSTVCVVGDSIIDEYRYVTPMQRSPKENIVPVDWHSSETFAGGVEAAANHIRSFCMSVDIASIGPVRRKVRMVERTGLRKLFEFQYEEDQATHRPQRRMDDYDVVVVTDFGHGEITKDYRTHLCQLPYVTVNAQTNAANYGFNLITNYTGVGYIVIDEPEARLAACDAQGPIEQILEKLAVGRCEKMIITRGSEGAVGFDGRRFCRVAAYAKRPIDTMGAGDAFYAVTAPMSQNGEIDDLLHIGSAAAAIKCDIVGHRVPVTKHDVVRFLTAQAKL